MGITPMVIRQKEFSTKFRGVDSHEVKIFLEEIAEVMEAADKEIHSISEENHRLSLEIQGYKEREDSMKKTMLQSRQVMEQMEENAKKSSQATIANAEVEAEKILSRAHNRLSQLHKDIMELKRQRIQLEMQIGAILESHSKMLDITKEENKIADDIDANLRFIQQAP